MNIYWHIYKENIRQDFQNTILASFLQCELSLVSFLESWSLTYMKHIRKSLSSSQSLGIKYNIVYIIVKIQPLYAIDQFLKLHPKIDMALCMWNIKWQRHCHFSQKSVFSESPFSSHLQEHVNKNRKSSISILMYKLFIFS